MGYLFFGQKETGAERVAMATSLRVSFCFFCDAHLWSQVSRTLLQYLLRYCLFSILPFLVANNNNENNDNDNDNNNSDSDSNSNSNSNSNNNNNSNSNSNSESE